MLVDSHTLLAHSAGANERPLALRPAVIALVAGSSCSDIGHTVVGCDGRAPVRSRWLRSSSAEGGCPVGSEFSCRREPTYRVKSTRLCRRRRAVTARLRVRQPSCAVGG